MNERNNYVIDKFNNSLKKPVVILFHMDQCHHCQELKPIWEKVNKKHNNLLDIESSQLPYLNHNIINDIHYFPKIVSVNNGTVIEEFQHERSENNINNFINRFNNSVKKSKSAKSAKSSKSAKSTKSSK